MTDYNTDRVLKALDDVIRYAEVARTEVSRGSGRIQEVEFVNDLYPVDVLTEAAGAVWVLFEAVDHLAYVIGADGQTLEALSDRSEQDRYEAVQK